MMKVKSQKGFTLIELLVYVGLIGIALTIVTALTINIIAVKQKSEITRETQENARFVIQRMTHQIRWANSISSISSDEIILDTNEGSVRFYLGGTGTDQMFIDKDGNTYELTTGGVKITGFSLTQMQPANAPPSVQIDLTLENRLSTDKGEYTGKTNLITSASIREK